MNEVPACALGVASERMELMPADLVQKSALGRPALATDGFAVLSASQTELTLPAIPDGNRSVVLPTVRTLFAGREWMVSVKGAGAAMAAYGASPVDSVFDASIEGRSIAGESWMGEAPYGAQGEIGAAQALEVTSLCDARGTIAGAHVCPVAAVVKIPEARVDRDRFWYRRHRGAVLQEHRLVPSDVRLYHGSGPALARDPEGVLRGFGVTEVSSLDAFADRYLASGLCALTLWARTARENHGAWEGLDFDDVWLDKDSLLACDGTIFLVDLESLEWMPATHRMDARARIKRQIDRNYYELMYGLDAILDVRDGWLDRDPEATSRRASVAERVALAIAGDPFVRASSAGDGVELAVRSPDGGEVRISFLDRR
jgi:hypothetical protein